MKGNFSWDRGLDYRKTYEMIVAEMRRLRGRKGVRAVRALAYNCVLLIQLRNGCRVSEAVEAALIFARTGRRELKVKVRKKRGEEFRTVIIPKELGGAERHILNAVNPKPANVKMYCRRRYGFNTHSLRCAFITYLAKKGVSPSMIAKITRHNRLDYILRYTQKVTADDILRKLE